MFCQQGGRVINLIHVIYATMIKSIIAIIGIIIAVKP